ADYLGDTPGLFFRCSVSCVARQEIDAHQCLAARSVRHLDPAGESKRVLGANLRRGERATYGQQPLAIFRTCLVPEEIRTPNLLTLSFSSGHVPPCSVVCQYAYIRRQ